MADYAPEEPVREVPPIAPHLFLSTRAAERWERKHNPYQRGTCEGIEWSIEFWEDQRDRVTDAALTLVTLIALAALVALAIVSVATR